MSRRKRLKTQNSCRMPVSDEAMQFATGHVSSRKRPKMPLSRRCLSGNACWHGRISELTTYTLHTTLHQPKIDSSHDLQKVSFKDGGETCESSMFVWAAQANDIFQEVAPCRYMLV